MYNKTKRNNYEYDDTSRFAIKSWTKGVPIEESARKQLHNIANLPFIHRHVAVMPDVHWGKGATIGSVIATKNAIVPAAVGVDLGCVDSETEYLSKDGWVKISQYDGSEVAQFKPDMETIEFVKPLNYINEEYDGEFLHFKNKYGVDQMLTPDHRCLVYKYDRSYKFNKYEVVLAEHIYDEHTRLVNGYRHRFLTTFRIDKTSKIENLTDDDIRVIVMICADGHYPNNTNRCNLHFSKNRKIERAKELLERNKIPFELRNNNDGTVTISFIAKQHTKVLNMWGASLEQIHVICDEVLNWDGSEKDGVFFSRSKEVVDFVQYCFTVIGKRASITVDERKDGSTDYRVIISDKIKVGINGSPKTEMYKVSQHDGRKYCFTVPSTFLVLRRNGNIFVTGNCGMNAVKTTLFTKDLPDNLSVLRHAIEEVIPHGRTNNGGLGDKGAFNEIPTSHMNRWNKLQARYNAIIEKHPLAKGFNTYNHMGTLGGGNHFFEICLDEDQVVWIMLHSGSRGAGNKIGQYFIEAAKREMEKYHIDSYLPDQDLSYLVEHTELFDDYVEAVQWAQDFALENRNAMMEAAIGVMKKHLPPFVTADFAINCHHNYVDREHHFGENVWVTRKGAVRARTGDLGIIPGSMGTGSFIVRGLGNEDSFHSCSHGAGRVMSRGAAKKLITMEDHAKAMTGIEARLDEGVLDESPAAYKDINAVMDAQSDLVEIVARLRQVLNIKG